MWCYLFLIPVLGIASGTSNFWDCRNPGFPCVSGSCNAASKTCTCPTGKGGYDCGYEIANAGRHNCAANNPCQNGGTCTDATSGPPFDSCYCKPQFYGYRCQNRRYKVKCHKNKMIVSLTPGFTAHGGIYAFGKKSCNTSYNPGTYTRTLYYSGTSGVCKPIIPTSPIGVIKQWEQKMFVQENADYVTDADFIVIFRCVFDGQSILSSSVITKTLNDDESFGETIVVGGIGRVALVASPNATPLSVGQEIEFTLTGNSDLAKIKLIKVTVMGNTGAAEIIISGGCRVADKEAFVKSNPVLTPGNNRQVKVTMYVVKFNVGTTVRWQFTVTTCLAGATSACAASSCNKRRRREIELDQSTDNSTEVMAYKIRVVEYTGEQYRTDERQNDCDNVDKIMAGLVVMAVLCFILLVVCLLLVFCSALSRRKAVCIREKICEDGPCSIPTMVPTKQ